MANILLEIGKGIEVAAEDVLKWAGAADNATAKYTPGALAAVGVVFAAVEKGAVDGAGAAAADGVNIVLDVATVNDIKAVWTDVKALLTSIGVKL